MRWHRFDIDAGFGTRRSRVPQEIPHPDAVETVAFSAELVDGSITEADAASPLAGAAAPAQARLWVLRLG